MDSEFKRSVHIINGLLVPVLVRQELVDALKNAEHYPDDVWIVSYPKSGTMWAAQIVRLIRSKGVQESKTLTDAVAWPECVHSELSSQMPLDEMPRPRILRSHFPYNKFPPGSPRDLPSKFIYVMRNPKDVAVSMFHVFNLKFKEKPMEWDQIFHMFISGHVLYGDYFTHILSWWAHRDSPNILFLKYEDMKKDLPQAVSQIAAFLEVDLSPDAVKKIADLTTFEHMKSDNTVNMSWVNMFIDEKGKPAFYRKGEVGDWKNHFSAEQSTELDRKIKEKLKDTGIEFEFE